MEGFFCFVTKKCCLFSSLNINDSSSVSHDKFRHQVSMKVLYPEKHTHTTAELQAGCSDVKAFVLKILLHDYCIHLKISNKVKQGFLLFYLFVSNKTTNLPKHFLSSRKM